MFKSDTTAWLSRHEDKEVLNLCQDYFSKIVETVKEMKEVVHSFCDENLNALDEHYNKALSTEREADGFKHKILQEISEGTLHPIDREEVVRLVLTTDDIAENAKSGARKLHISSAEILTNEINTNFKEMANRCLEIVEKTKLAFEKLSEHDVAMQIADEVERLEEGIDEYRLNLVKLILNRSNDVKSIGSWLMVLETIDNMEEVSDSCEDVADTIRTIAMLG